MAQDRKVFVGGVPQDLNQDDLYAIFSDFAGVKKAWLQKCRSAEEGGASNLASPPQNHRGFGFVIFHDAHAIDDLLGAASSRFIVLRNGNKLEVKRALSSNKMAGPPGDLALTSEQATRRHQQQQALHTAAGRHSGGPWHTTNDAVVLRQLAIIQQSNMTPSEAAIAAQAIYTSGGQQALYGALLAPQANGFRPMLPPMAALPQLPPLQALGLGELQPRPPPLREAIMRFYNQHRPEKLSERDFIDFICNVYEGREAELDEALRQKYGIGLRLPPEIAGKYAQLRKDGGDFVPRSNSKTAPATAGGVESQILDPAAHNQNVVQDVSGVHPQPVFRQAMAPQGGPGVPNGPAATFRHPRQAAGGIWMAGGRHQDPSEEPDFSWIDQIVGADENGLEMSEEVARAIASKSASMQGMQGMQRKDLFAGALRL